MKNKFKRVNPLAFISAIVVIAAAVVTFLPNAPAEPAPVETQVVEGAPSVTGDNLVIHTTDIGSEASYFDYDANGTTIQVFAVEASDGTIRLALNTCQVCNGSPYAYFVQDGDTFICQNCKNRFASTEVGIASGGCRPVPITDDIYTQQDDTITIPASFLEGSADLFKNWKKF